MSEEKTLINIMRDFEIKHISKMEELALGQQSNKQEVGHVKEALCRIELKLDGMNTKLDEKDTAIMKAFQERERRWDDKFAPKLSWDILRYGGSIIMAMLITAFMYLIIKQ